jgi:hypothetical protein
MANIPGISGYVQPGTFARDRVITTGVSIPGGIRIACIMGEGLREEVIIEAAAGNGQDGSSECSPTGNGDSKYFMLAQSPVISGRTKVYLNGTELYGTEQAIDDASFPSKFDFRLDIDSGCIELQGASIGDQNGKKYSASSSNVGNGTIVDGTCGDYELISIVDSNAVPERWTIRCVSVIRDSSGAPIPGLSTFTVAGSVSGQIRDSSGAPILFHGTNPALFNRSGGAVPGSTDICTDSYVVANDAVYGPGSSDFDSATDSTSGTTDRFQVTADLVSPGQVLAGDYLCITDDGYTPADGIQIKSLSYSSSTGKTTLILETDTLDSALSNVSWSIKVKDIFIDDYTVAHNSSGTPATAGYFTSRDVGKVLLICDGPAPGYYVIKAVTSSRRVRVHLLGDTTVAYPELAEGSVPGIADTGESVTFSILETNGIIVFGIREGLAVGDTSGPDIPFAVGDKFFIDVKSKILKKGDRLEAKYIPEITINDAEFFTSAKDLFSKHGTPSATNTLSLGAQIAFENGAPGLLAIQCKPAVARRSSIVLYAEKNSKGVGGFPACGGVAANCQVDDLSFIIPKPVSGLGSGRPDGDTGVNFFVTRSGVETQIFPNKVDFYNSQFESETAQYSFITNPQYSYSYTVVNTDVQITGAGIGATIDTTTGYFESLDVNFDSTDIGRIIVIQSLEHGTTVSTTKDEISDYLLAAPTGQAIVEFEIISIVNDNAAVISPTSGSFNTLGNNATDVVFFVKDVSNTTDVSAKILLHKDLVDSKTLKPGDGLRVSYIDEKDVTFFDTNWFEAFETIEASECQVVVPLPTQNISGIFRAAVSHCETMSTIANQKERVALIGAQRGITPAALLGQEEVAIEDIGVLEGIQGDDVTEVLDGNTEDLANYKLSDNYNSNRAVYFYPDQIIRNISGTNSFISGFYMSAAAAGYLSATQNVAVPLTFKELTGFSIGRDRVFRKVILDQLGGVGATVVQPITGGGRVLAGRTTSQSGFVEDEEISIVFIRDRVKKVLRDSMMSFVGTVEDSNTPGIMTAKVKTIMSALVSQGLITDFKNIRVEKDKVDPRQWNIYLTFTPAYPINYIFIDLEIGIS